MLVLALYLADWLAMLIGLQVVLQLAGCPVVLRLAGHQVAP